MKRMLAHSALFLMAFLLVLPAGAEGIVLCLCHDGHMSVEAGCDPRACCPEDECASVPDDDCGETACSHAAETPSAPAHSCTDIPLPIGNSLREARPVTAASSNEGLLTGVLASAVPARAMLEENRVASLGFIPDAVAQPATICLRTVRLLI